MFQHPTLDNRHNEKLSISIVQLRHSISYIIILGKARYIHCIYCPSTCVKPSPILKMSNETIFFSNTIERIEIISTKLISGLTLPFYLFILYVLIKFRKTELGGSFFKICISLGFVDTSYIILKVLIWHLIIYYIDESSSVILGLKFLYVFFLFYLYNCQIAGVVILAFNRYISISRPLQYDSVSVSVSVK